MSNYMPSYATSTNQGYFNFDFYNLAFAETEEQFNYLTNKTVEASLNALNAYNAANSANTAAQQAKTSADAAKTSADTAATRAQTTINQTWYSGKYGGTAESTADITGYIRCLHNHLTIRQKPYPCRN
ncbi:MAG: hypothetical protein HPY89_11255 [Pelotomaculum sp.]|nr:hypothetical protein [Pelotomaculum sp.]